MAIKSRGVRKRGTGPAHGQSSTASGAHARGRPFSKNYDARRNLKGRKTNPNRTPSEIMMDALLSKQVVTRNGKRRTMTKLEVILEQQAVQAMQGDQKAIRALATLIRAAKDMATPDTHGAEGRQSVHNVKELDSLLEEYGRMFAEAREETRARDALRDENDDE